MNPPPSAPTGKPRPASETTPEAAALGATATAERSAAGSSSRRLARRPAVLIGALAEWLGKPRATLLGARIAFHRPIGRDPIPTLSVDGSFGGLASDSGRVSARTLGVAAHVYAGAAIGRFRFDAGPGARIAWLWLRGEAATPAVEGRALSAAWGGPEVRARVAYGPFRAPLVALSSAPGSSRAPCTVS